MNAITTESFEVYGTNMLSKSRAKLPLTTSV